MFKRQEVRHTCFRKSNNSVYAEDRQYIVDHIEEHVMLPSDAWEDFSKKWDVFVTKEGISRIVPEVDYDFVHSTCIEIQTKIAIGQDPAAVYSSLAQRQKNIFDMIELNYLGEHVDWSEYNKSWIVEINHQSKRIEVKSLNTQVNEVTFEQPKERTDLQEAVSAALDLQPVKEEDLDEDLVAKLKKLLAKEEE
jgi:hypothetical protein